MGIIDRIKDIIFKIKDYDRLESDYYTCLCYFTNNRMSKPNYELGTVVTVIGDAIGEYMLQGYDAATEKAEMWLREKQEDYILTDNDITDFVNYMKGE